MTPLMQTIFEELRACELGNYIDKSSQDAYDMELEAIFLATYAAARELR